MLEVPAVKDHRKYHRHTGNAFEQIERVIKDGVYKEVYYSEKYVERINECVKEMADHIDAQVLEHFLAEHQLKLE